MKELSEIAKKLNFTYSLQIAMSGSVYIRVDGIKFRIANHVQPSYFQSRNYFDVNNENEVISIITNPLFSFYANPIIKDGQFYNAIHNEVNDTFRLIKISESKYNELVLKMEERKVFWLSRGYDGDITN